MLDKQGKGFLTGPDLSQVLQEMNIFPHKEDVFLFTRHYDRDSDGRLLYSDYCDAFSPLEQQSSECLSKRESHNNNLCSDFFSCETKEIYRRLLKLHFTFEESNELLRKRLSKRQHFNVHTAFSMLDYDSNGYLIADNFRRFLGES